VQVATIAVAEDMAAEDTVAVEATMTAGAAEGATAAARVAMAVAAAAAATTTVAAAATVAVEGATELCHTDRTAIAPKLHCFVLKH
jgi:hypothetical protein